MSASSLSPSAHTVAVLLDDALVTLNRAFGVLRRRNVPIEGLALHPSGTTGVSRLTFVLKADAVTGAGFTIEKRQVVLNVICKKP